MKLNIHLIALPLLLLVPSAGYSAEQADAPNQKAKIALQQLKEQSDNPNAPNEPDGLSYASKTELLRQQSIRDLRTEGAVGVTLVKDELETAKGEYRQMLTISLAALGDKDSIAATVELMLHAQHPAVRFVAAAELRALKNKELIEPFKQALADPFKRRNGGCVGPGIIYPVRLIASDALADLGLTLEEIRKVGKWWDG